MNYEICPCCGKPKRPKNEDSGDSRRLAEVIAGAGLVVSSPPYATQIINSSSNGIDWEKAGRPDRTKPSPNRISPGIDGGLKYGITPGQLAALKEGDITAVISSPPFAGNTGGRGEASRNGIDAALFDRHSGGMKKGTGSDPANLDHLPMGTVGAVIASPPYAESLKPETEDQTRRKQERIAKSKSLYDGRAIEIPSAGKAALGGGYGSTSGQLGAMVVGSPPFENSLHNWNVKEDFFEHPTQKDNHKYADNVTVKNADYGSTPGQIGTESGETFWTAARLIVDQCYQILPDGAAAIWVVKSYVKGGKLVDFPGQWQALCEACGFETVEIIRAWLVKRNGAQGTIEGGTVSKDVARKSFFRRLAEKNGSPPIDFETVLVTRKKGVQ